MEFKKEFQAFYETARELVEKNILDIGMKLDSLEDTEETEYKEFYLTVMTYFLQKRQKEVIKEGLF